MRKALLHEIGLTGNEVEVYSALFRVGPCTTGKLTRECGLYKSRVYESLEKLLEKGLVGYHIRGKAKWFEAFDPDKLLDFLEEKKAKIDAEKADVERLVPELRKLKGEQKPEAEAHVFVGIEGMKAMRRDVLKHAERELLGLGWIAREYYVYPHFFSLWDRERKKKGIFIRIIHQRWAQKKIREVELSESRFLPKWFKTTVPINIYGDRVVTALWKGDYPICFMIINRDIADAYRKYFEMLWRISKK